AFDSSMFGVAVRVVNKAGMKRPLRKTALAPVLLAGALLAVAVSAEAQQTGKVFHIGFLDSSTASGMAVLVDAFRHELSKRGWIEGKNVSIEYRFAEQKLDRVHDLAAELVRRKVDLIVVSGTPSAVAAKKQTTLIPIVMAAAGD